MSHKERDIPNTKTEAAQMLYRSAEYIRSNCKADYHDHKTGQGLQSLADLLMAQACWESWFIDLGTNGCQVD